MNANLLRKGSSGPSVRSPHASSFRPDRAAPYRLKNDDNVDPAEVDAASGFAGAGCAAGAGAGSSRFERFDE